MVLLAGCIEAGAQSANSLQWRFDQQPRQPQAGTGKNMPVKTPLDLGRLAQPDPGPVDEGSFGNFLTIRSNPPSTSSGFADAMRKTTAEGRIYAECDKNPETCISTLRRWRGLVKTLRDLNRAQQIQIVNSAINGLIKFRRDKSAHGRMDYWASPIEALTNGDDCEDYSILKYVTLRELGFAEEAMRLVVMKGTRKNEGHAVLSIVHEGKTIVLDNQFAAPVGTEQVSHYRPVYSVSGKNRWIYLAYKRRPELATIVRTVY
ncbi:MAG: transglutaminase-like cysteine peptidase [Hyphomicrobiales bacterium]